MWSFSGLRRVGKSSWAVEVMGRLGFLCLKVKCYEIQTVRELVTPAIRDLEKLEKKAPFFRLRLISQGSIPCSCRWWRGEGLRAGKWVSDPCAERRRS